MDASKSSPSWAAGQTIWQALKRTPGLIAGGAVDVANLAMGVLAGKGLEGLSAKPVGGGEWINEKFGMPASKDAFQQGTEAALSMLSPGGLAKGALIGGTAALTMANMAGGKAGEKLVKGLAGNQRGVIVPLTASNEIAKTLGIEKVVDRAEDMAKTGESAWKIGVESEQALAAARNPGGAMSVFVGPDGIPRLKIDPAVASIPKSAGIKTVPAWYGTRTAAKLPNSMLAGKDELLGPEIPLSDILYHPSLYNISPTARTATVGHSALLDLFGGSGGYSATNNMISLPRTSLGPARIKNDPMGYLLETLLHESTHLLQMENKVRSGGSAKIDSILRNITEAETSGSFRSPAELAKLKTYAESLRSMPDSANKDALIHNLYMSNYGEWEARQGSQYGRSLPMMNERGATY